MKFTQAELEARMYLALATTDHPVELYNLAITHHTTNGNEHDQYSLTLLENTFTIHKYFLAIDEVVSYWLLKLPQHASLARAELCRYYDLLIPQLENHGIAAYVTLALIDFALASALHTQVINEYEWRRQHRFTTWQTSSLPIAEIDPRSCRALSYLYYARDRLQQDPEVETQTRDAYAGHNIDAYLQQRFTDTNYNLAGLIREIESTLAQASHEQNPTVIAFGRNTAHVTLLPDIIGRAKQQADNMLPTVTRTPT